MSCPHSLEKVRISMLDGAKLGEAIAEGLNKGGAAALNESIQKFEE